MISSQRILMYPKTWSKGRSPRPWLIVPRTALPYHETGGELSGISLDVILNDG